MAKKEVGISQKQSRIYRLNLIQNKRNELVKALSKEGYSYGEISDIVRLDKASVSRVARFGKNTSKPASAA